MDCFYKDLSKKEPLIHCKNCRGLLVKDIMKMGDISGFISFLIRCPHCKKDCAVKVGVDHVPVIKTI